MPVMIQGHDLPFYEQKADEIRTLLEQGMTVAAIARRYGVLWQTAQRMVKFARTGERPKTTSHPRRMRGKTGRPRPNFYKEIADEVVRLREQERMPLAQIGKKLGASKETVRRAWDYAKRTTGAKATENGVKTLGLSSGYSKIGIEKVREIQRRLTAGESPARIAKAIGCCWETVGREKVKMDAAAKAEHNVRAAS